MRAQARWLVILLAFGAAFILFQIYVLQATWVNFENPDRGKTKKKRKYDDWTPPADYIAVQLFTEVASELNVPVFLIEPSILETIWKHRTGQQKVPASYCRFLCTRTNSTAFGVISNRWITQKLLDALHRSGFKSIKVGERGDPRKLSVSELVPPTVPYHYFFIHEGHLLHLVIFYERVGAYLWHGSIDVDPSTSEEALADVSIIDLPFCGQHASSFQKMEFADIRVDDVRLTVPKYPLTFVKQLPKSRHLECNFQQAREFLAEYGKEDTAQDDDFRSRAREILRRGAEALDKIGVPFWVSSGTCLGWFRECNIIGHSMDVDLGMKIRDYNGRVIPAMESQGLQLLHLFGKKEDSFELSFASDGIKLDIFFFYEEEDFIWNGGTDDKTGDKFQYVFHPFELCWTELVGLRVRVPCPTLPYIEANYGSDWNQKVTEWDWKDSPPNVRPNGRWPEAEWPWVMQTFPVM